MKIGFVIQRYGTEVLGGSEHLCRLVAERLAAQHEVDVLTTCARDYVTWKNEYPEGADRIRGVTVRRFANARTRDLAAFNKYSEWIFNNAHSRADEMEWLKQQGPWCPTLVEYVRRQQLVPRPAVNELLTGTFRLGNHRIELLGLRHLTRRARTAVAPRCRTRGSRAPCAGRRWRRAGSRGEPAPRRTTRPKATFRTRERPWSSASSMPSPATRSPSRAM